MENVRAVCIKRTAIMPNITKVSENHWLVPSRTTKGATYHVARHIGKKGEFWTCGCPQAVFHKKCWHIEQVIQSLGSDVKIGKATDSTSSQAGVQGQ